MNGTSIADIYGSSMRASGGGGGGAPVQSAASVQETGQPVTHLSVLAWVSMVGALVLIRLLWEFSE